MVLYVLFILLLWVVFLNYHTKNEKSSTVLLLCIISFYWGWSLISALDMEDYMSMFAEMDLSKSVFDSLSSPIFSSFEKGFIMMMYLCKSIIPSFFFFQFVLFSLELCLVYRGVSLLLEDKYESFVFFVLIALSSSTFLLYAMRQGVGIAFFIYALGQWKAKNYIKYAISFAVGTFFHSSVVFLSVMPLWSLFFSRFLDKRIVCFAILITCNFLYFSGFELSKYLNPFLTFFGDENDFLTRDYSFYSLSDSINFGILKLIEIDFCFIILFIFRRVEDKPYYRLLAPIFIVYFIINTTVGGIIVHRLTYYFQFIYYILLFASLRAVIRFDTHLKKLPDCIIFVYMIVYHISQFAPFSYNHEYEWHLMDVFI